LGLLNGPQRLRMLDALHPAAGLDQAIALIDQIRSAGRCCPRCGSGHWHRHGHANDLQRFRCRECGHTFNDVSGTPLARLRLRGKWIDYLNTLLESKAIRKTANRAGVHRNTAFRWRHRFPDWVKLDRAPQLKGIVEADEMFILESQKGSRKLDRPARHRGGTAIRRGISRELDCVLIARDRSGNTMDAVTGRGALKAVRLARHLLPKLDRQALLVTDANAAYRAFARRYGTAHQPVNLTAGVRVRPGMQGATHVQTVNAYHGRFRAWLAHFHGVASRYIPNYPGWYRALDVGRVTSSEQLLRMAISFINR
jgi:transposase-like protein